MEPREFRGYQVYRDGRIWSPKTNRWLKSSISNSGYPQVTLGKPIKLHQIVALLYVPNPLGLPQVDHIDENRLNPHADNLQWITGRDNIQKSFAIKRYNFPDRKGVNHNNVRLTEEQARAIKYDFPNTDGETLAKRFGVRRQTIWGIRNSKIWKHI
jgi:hypothetical protein